MALYRSYSRVNVNPSKTSQHETTLGVGGGMGLQKSASGIFPMGRSASTVFTHQPSTQYTKSSRYTPTYSGYSGGYSTFSLSREPPRFSDKYPHVRYGRDPVGYTMPQDSGTYGASPYFSSAYSARNYSGYQTPNPSGHSNVRSWRYSRPSTLPTSEIGGSYSSVKYISPYKGAAYDRPHAPARSYVGHMGVDDAVDLYKKKYFTSSQLSKYWLSGSSPTPMTTYKQATTRQSVWKTSLELPSGGYSKTSFRYR